MLKFSNLSILWKVLCLTGLLAACTLGGALYSTSRMRAIDTRYGDLLDGFGRANLAIARANRNLVYVDRCIYRLLAEADAARKQEAASEAADSVGFFQKQIKAATYRAKINEFLTVQPDVQYIVKPNYGATLKNPLVLGLHFEIGHVFEW